MDHYIPHATALPEGLLVDVAASANSVSSQWSLSGVGPMTPVETDLGPFPALALRVRDRVRLRSGAFRPLTFVDHLLLDEDYLSYNFEAQPVLVQPGRLGFAMPKHPVLVAPGQKLSVGSGLDQVLLTGHDLLRAGIGLRRPERSMTYVVLGFDEPADYAVPVFGFVSSRAPVCLKVRTERARLR